MTERRRTIGKLTPRMLAQSRVIAKGNRIRDAQRLVEHTVAGDPDGSRKVALASSLVGITTSTIGMNIPALGGWN
ncbi:MAG: hypothetical protein ACREOH_13250 [Candidatus Entotheonellia bacterium]